MQAVIQNPRNIVPMSDPENQAVIRVQFGQTSAEVELTPLLPPELMLSGKLGKTTARAITTLSTKPG